MTILTQHHRSFTTITDRLKGSPHLNMLVTFNDQVTSFYLIHHNDWSCYLIAEDCFNNHDVLVGLGFKRKVVHLVPFYGETCKYEYINNNVEGVLAPVILEVALITPELIKARAIAEWTTTLLGDGIDDGGVRLKSFSQAGDIWCKLFQMFELGKTNVREKLQKALSGD